MSPLAISLLGRGSYAPQPGSPESVDLLVDAVLCSQDPETLACVPAIAFVGGELRPEVRVALNGVSWSLDLHGALTAARQIICSRSPDVHRRQSYRFVHATLCRVGREAQLQVDAARLRGAH